MKELLDTNVASELRKVPKRACAPNFIRWASATNTEEHYLSVISVLEISRGILLKERYDAAQAQVFELWLESLLATLGDRLLAVDYGIVSLAAKLHVPYSRPELDTLIAATAIAYDLPLVTRNTADFEGTGVRLFNPWLDEPSHAR